MGVIIVAVAVRVPPDVAAQAETTVFALGRAVKEIEQLLGSKVAHVNAKHLIKRACQGMTERPGKDGMAVQAKGSLIMWPKEVMADLEKVAGELYDLLDACLLQVGRKPVTVAPPTPRFFAWDRTFTRGSRQDDATSPVPSGDASSTT